jgi:hypothetical protein
MNKINYVLFLLVFALFSCDKESMKEEQLIDVSTQKVEQVLLLKADKQKLAYALLTSVEKVKVWQKHLEIEFEKDIYNKSQKEYIDYALNSINPSWFNKDRKPEVSNKIIEIRKIGFKYFTKNQLYNLIASLAGNSSIAISKYDPPLGICTCNHVNDWCSYGSDCFGTPYCGYSTSGCGDFWGDACTGICKSRDN